MFETHNLHDLLRTHLPEIIHTNINCKYYLDNHLRQTLQKKSPALSLFHLNIRSFSKHRNELQVQLNSLGKPFNVLCLTEIGQNNIESSAAFFKGYKLQYDPATTIRGGAAILLGPEVNLVTERKDLALKGTHISDNNYLIENSWAEIRVPGIEGNVIIGCIYRHPKGRVDLFTEEFEKTCQKISKEGKLCFVAGDFNINALNRSHPHTVNYVNTILSENFIPHITVPTRLTENTATLIDNILVKHGKKLTDSDILAGNLYCDISDHLPNFLLYGEQKPEKHRPYVRIFRPQLFD